MKNKFLKKFVVMLVIIAMTMTNFIFVGKGLISYAIDLVSTNHQNVTFEAYFKNKDGNKITTLQTAEEQDEIFLYLNVNVKKEGYFNGEITLEDSNFTIKEASSEYVNRIENNTIYLNQISLGTVNEIPVRIEPIKEELFEIGLLNVTSKLNLIGIYRDSTEKDINIKATRKLILEITENNTQYNILNDMQLITNKVIQLNGQDKTVIQFAYNMGLKENNYPVKEIKSKIIIPEINGTFAQVKCISNLNNMNKFDYTYNKNSVEITMQNKTNEQGKANWKQQGSEYVILTCVYNGNINLENSQFIANQKVMLYDDKEVETENSFLIGANELDAIVQIDSKNDEEMIYKGKINSGIARQFQNITELKINYAEAVKSIELTEEPSRYIIGETEKIANVIYNSTIIKKENFDKLFGQNGVVTIYGKNNEILGTITSETVANEQGNIIISYEGKNINKITIRATNPMAEGTLQLKHTKTICETENLSRDVSELKNKISVLYNTSVKQEKEVSMKLENTVTEGTIEISREDLSTAISNNLEMKVILLSNNEKYDLYTNPKITIQLPEQIQNVTVNSIDLLYGNGLSIKNYEINGRTINIFMEGQQVQYNEDVVNGATIVINSTIDVNKTSPTSDAEIQMIYSNERAVTYASGEQGIISKGIKIIAPKDITTIYNIQDLGIETIGQEEQTEVIMEKGADEKQLQAQFEIINNNENSIEDVKILGDLPTDNETNNMGIKMLEGINLTGIENAKVYYSNNPNATEDLDNEENYWSESITDNSQTSKYLIITEDMPAKSSIRGAYTYSVPTNLEYNQIAKTKYMVKNTNSQTGMQSELNSTEITMTTGIGPEVEAKLTATRGGKEIKDSVKNGEIIRYNIEVSNIGSEDVTGIKVKGNVPEGTVLVEPEEDYEYTGASYYKELENKTYEKTIESLKAGEHINITYEVRVNNEVKAGTVLTNISEIVYGDVTKQTNEVQTEIANGDLRITVKRVTDRQAQLYPLGIVRYFAIVENISDKSQENVKIKTNITDNVVVNKVQLTTNMPIKEKSGHLINSTVNIEENPPEMEEMQYSSEMNIGTIEPGKNKVLIYLLTIPQKIDSNLINFSAEVLTENDKYESNICEDVVNQIELNLTIKSNTPSEYVKSGDNIQYVITVENKADSTANSVIIEDVVPKQLTINKVIFDSKEMDNIEFNEVYMPIELEKGETSSIIIDTVVNYSESRDKAETITNSAVAMIDDVTIATTPTIEHIIEANPQDPDSIIENNGDDSADDLVGTDDGTISGTAWYDENSNGKREQGEELLSNIKVKLLNTQTNSFVKNAQGNVIEVNTDERGQYRLEKIANGEYIVVFEYNDVQYKLTKYKVDGLSDMENSDVLMNDLLIENENKQVASTDILKLNSNNISNIDIGLVKAQNFDLKLDKYVSRILIQNTSGTAIRQFDGASLAKAEIPGKDLNNSTVIIEYKIKVTNNGEIEGYAKKIADYIPADLSFNSELNKNWYQTGNVLYTDSLANEKIKPGESRTLTLTLTKRMTENNTGSIPNVAEIVEDYNELGVKDSNSTPGNRAKTENDYSIAETIISVKTGEIVYTGLIIAIIIGLTILVIIVVVNRKDNIDEI